jgi:adenine-specific DNA-methyltransferase
MSKYEELVSKLKEIFQIDRPELDFGIYRILNARAGETNDYLDNRLKAKVHDTLAATGMATAEALKMELREKESQYRSDGMDPDSVPKILELRQKIAEYGTGAAEHENAVFTHLLTFFSRYYDKGDFISQRRYKGDTYAIPYSGEEVVLHWANKDQYYTKSGEYFSNYAFKLSDGRTVRFHLVAADTAKDNRKDNDKERRFVLVEPENRIRIDEDGREYEEQLQTLEELNGELVVHFDYKPMTKGTKQADLVARAVKTLLDHPVLKTRWMELAELMPTEKNPKRSLLEKCLTSYTEKNLADYFIHKDLGGFLRRELDFYIKNEVMNLDDVQCAGAFADIEKNLRMIQILRAIALDLITFLAQLEEFQKTLWLKKKFVVSAHYCMTLDRVPESLYPAIAANEIQWEQWRELGMLEDEAGRDLFNQGRPGSVEYLKAHPYLMADTSLYDKVFRAALLQSVDNLDETTDGLLINGDNFQVLNLLQDRYREQVKCVYIDPPYNTAASEIIYKNSYKHSSWQSMMFDRIDKGVQLLNLDGNICVTIDDVEFNGLMSLLKEIFGDENFEGIVPIRINPSGRPTERGFALTHEYGIFFGKSSVSAISKIPRTEAQLSRFTEEDYKGRFEWRNLRREGSNSDRADGERQYYPIYGNLLTGNVRVPDMQWQENERKWLITDSIGGEEVEIYPVNDDGREKNWRWSEESVRKDYSQFLARVPRGGFPQVYYKYRENQLGTTPLTMWVDSKYSATEYGTKILKDLFNETPFSYPKSIHAVQECLIVMGARLLKGEYILDYFAGSGTTGHAVINLNREGQGKRKYILVEQGDYFDTVLKPRIQKVVYSAEWKDGKATASETGISHSVKVLRIESYEDSLNNLKLLRTEAQQNLLDSIPKPAQDEYLLSYMLDVESRGSLLSVAHFMKPFDCRLKVAVDSAGSYRELPIDLVETFNYLLGLRVRTIDMQQERGFVLVTGTMPTGEKTLLLWRDQELVDYEGLNRLCNKLNINPADSEYELVYINGDHNIPAVFTCADAEGGLTKSLKIRQIEPEFLSRMFAVEAV